MKNLQAAAAVFLILAAGSSSAAAASLNEVFLFQATAETEDGTYFHWEYNSPDSYEYHAEGRAWHGRKARPHVEKLYEQTGISPSSTKEELAEVFQNTDLPPLKRLDVRWQDGEGELYTWLWEQDK
ncbi:hypothetical protein [Salibacterium halotolerans]|uniref:Uncharacterized protein n=1 Tax=Salibacterium halotolerans TaxID=1884432 RepID=A0A1I5VHV4_9BACI|nr:hypothetical protein [Salibacterium halotolerans]SFQ06927.1 hypothetical protein SAMN05518683_11634 [Salibacterium halotolerans]